MGDIAAALALEHFDLKLPERRAKGVDALTQTGKTVQIKASGLKNRGLVFTPGTGVAHYLIFFQFNFEAGSATVFYNGLEEPVRREVLPKS